MQSIYTGKNRLLRALPQDGLDRFYAALEPVSLTLRQVVQEASTPNEHVYFLEDGVGSILTIMTDGSSIEVGMVGNEGMIGVTALLDADAAAQHVIIQVPGDAMRMPVALCRSGFNESAAVREVLLRFAGNLLNVSAQTAACNRLHTIEQRCARWLLMAYDRVKIDTMPMTHEFLASMLGVRRAGVTTAAAELQRSGLISYRQREITILDPEGLKALACECYHVDHERLARRA